MKSREELNALKEEKDGAATPSALAYPISFSRNSCFTYAPLFADSDLPASVCFFICA